MSKRKGGDAGEMREERHLTTTPPVAPPVSKEISSDPVKLAKWKAYWDDILRWWKQEMENEERNRSSHNMEEDDHGV